jgi:hypothetical protein
MTTCPPDVSARRRISTPNFADWLAVVNTRARRALRCAPVDQIAADKAAMLTLPPVARPDDWVAVLHPAGARYRHEMRSLRALARPAARQTRTTGSCAFVYMNSKSELATPHALARSARTSRPSTALNYGSRSRRRVR